MIRNVAYQPGLERFANALKQYGFSVYPWRSEGIFDALIFSEEKNTGFLSRIKTGKKSVFMLNVCALSPANAANMLQTRLYSPVFTSRPDPRHTLSS